VDHHDLCHVKQDRIRIAFAGDFAFEINRGNLIGVERQIHLPCPSPEDPRHMPIGHQQVLANDKAGTRIRSHVIWNLDASNRRNRLFYSLLCFAEPKETPLASWRLKRIVPYVNRWSTYLVNNCFQRVEATSGSLCIWVAPEQVKRLQRLVVRSASGDVELFTLATSAHGGFKLLMR
jgi:hypothetical protein